MTCFAGVALFGAIPGIGIAVAIAVIEFLWDGWRPHSAVLGRVDGVKGYHDITRYPRGAAASPGWSCSAGMRPCSSPTPSSSATACSRRWRARPRRASWVVVAAEPVTSVDVTAADIVAELDDALRADGVELSFAEMKDPVKDKLKRFGLFERFGAETFYPTLGEAVKAYLAQPSRRVGRLGGRDAEVFGLIRSKQ